MPISDDELDDAIRSVMFRRFEPILAQVDASSEESCIIKEIHELQVQVVLERTRRSKFYYLRAHGYRFPEGR